MVLSIEERRFYKWLSERTVFLAFLQTFHTAFYITLTVYLELCVNNQHDALFIFVYLVITPLHFSGVSAAHNQEA
jgi:hypothetical protein